MGQHFRLQAFSLLLRRHRRGRPYDILSEAVYGFMNQVGEGHHADLMRAFFRLRVADIGRLLPQVRDSTRRMLGETPTTIPNILSEANGIVLVCRFRCDADHFASELNPLP